MNKTKRLPLCIALLLVVLSCTQSTITFEHPKKGFASWMPAQNWEDALLTGNGTLGAMVMGDPYQETIILNHALLYMPNDAPVIPPNMAAHLDEIRKLSFDGKFGEAAELGLKIWKDEGYGDKKWTDPYVPAADISIDMPSGNVSNYLRSVNYETAEANVNWKDEKGVYERKTFVSRADGVIVTQIKGTRAVDAKISIGEHPHSWEQNQLIQSLISASNTRKVENGILGYRCEYRKPHENSPLGYNALMRVVVKQGEMETSDNQIVVNGASEVLIFTTISPFYQLNDNSVSRLTEQLNSIDKNYKALLRRQVKTHGEFYNRSSINLYPTAEEQEMTSENLVKAVREKTSPGKMQRQFEAARYNILCSTGTNPPNLQGIWSGTWTPPWCSDFTHDGNVEVAISNLLNGNMAELMLAYFDNHERVIDNYRVNAKQFYGVKGIQVPSRTSTHGYNNHYDETWCMEYWNAGAGWAASFYYDYFLYTQDTTFLKERAFPFINEALLFWEDFLITGDDGKYISVPSYSPENNPLERQWQNCINATMDIVVAKELARNWISCAKILGIEEDQIQDKEEFIAALPEYQISKDGVLKEWLWEGFTDNQSHRHASHLYGLYEVPDPDILNSKELMDAVAKTIHERMKIRSEQQGGEMAFGMCHLADAAVNIGDTETAAEILGYLSRFYWTNGMATLHNPRNLFNMDISGGLPSLMTRMIINSRPGNIDVLANIPSDWTKGEAKGILARGGIVIESIQWDKDKITMKMISKVNQNVDVGLGRQWKATVDVIKGAEQMAKLGNIKLLLKKNKSVTIIWTLNNEG